MTTIPRPRAGASVAADDATGRALAEAVAALRSRAGSRAEARLEAEVLLASVLGTERSRLLGRPAPSADERARFERLVAERARTGRPVAYLVGSKGFWDVELQVDERVLVPRPETEGLIEAVEARLAAGEVPPGPIVDRGTGSGALAVVLARHRPVLALDVSADALDVAAVNVARHRDHGRVLLARGDGTGCVASRSAAVVVANPPYVGRDELARLDADVRDHEPHVALVASEGSADAMYERLVADAARVLVPGGWLVTEVGAGQARGVAARLGAAFERVVVERDLAGIERVVVGRRAG